MRLTLRALLAYLDDVLEPSQLKEIGARVSESPAAAATVSRIKEVVRRRRIAAPELAGSGSAPDPNIVAEYLDNTLDAAAVPALEKLCLDSDMHLAEVASSHQILTAVLGEPVDVPMTTRERMYALVSQAPAINEPTPPPADAVRSAPATQPVAATHSPSASPAVSADYLRPPGGRRFMWGVLGLLIAAGWLGWVLQDQGWLPRSNNSNAVAINDPGSKVDSPPSEVVANGVTPADHSPPPAEVAVSKKPSENPSGLAAKPEVAQQETEVVMPDTELAANIPPNVVTPPQPEAAVPMPEAPVPDEPDAKPEPTPAAPAEAEVRAEFPATLYTNGEGILLIYDRPTDQWNVMPRRALLHDGDEIATPDPFQSDLTVDGTRLEITLHGGSRIKLETSAAPHLLVMTIDRGRVSLRRPHSGDQKAPVSVKLNLRGQSATVSLNEPGALCGLEVGQRAPQGQVPDPLLTFPEGGLHVVTGDVSMSWNGGPEVAVNSNVGWAAWPIPPNTIEAGPTRAVPPWLTPEGTPLTAADKKWNLMFEKEFALDQPVSMSIPALILDRRERISSLATYALGLVDDIPSLVKALHSDYEETRLAAIWSLRGWLPSDPNHPAQLQAEVQRTFPDEDVSDVIELIWGYSPLDAKDPGISKKLVAWMDHKDIAIRELAFFHVTRLTGRTNAHGYRPNLPDSPRNAALMGWRNLLERNGGMLLK